MMHHKTYNVNVLVSQFTDIKDEQYKNRHLCTVLYQQEQLSNDISQSNQ